MKLTYELKDGKGIVTLEVGGKQFQETWHDEDCGFNETEGAAITTQIERMCDAQEIDYPFCIEQMDVDLPYGSDVFDILACVESDLVELLNEQKV